MTGFLAPPVKRLGVDAVEPAHSPDQVGLGGLDQQVIMVVHQAEGVTDPTLLVDLFAEQIEKSSPITVVDKYRFLPVAPRGQMIEGSGKF